MISLGQLLLLLLLVLFLSPIAVAIINNIHHTKIRKLELTHDEHLRQMDLQVQAATRQSDIYYSDKKLAFSEFAECAGAFSLSRKDGNRYQALHSSIDRALIFCTSDNRALLKDFQHYIDSQIYQSTHGTNEHIEYSDTVNKICCSLNQELESTKPVIQCEASKG